MKDNNQEEWENDSVWNLVDSVEAPKAGPAFAQDVMRKVRQSAGEPARPWWKALFAPVPLTAGALAAAAAVAFMVHFGGTPGTPKVAGGGTDLPENPPVEALAIEDELNQQLLIAAVEDPSLVSDEELLAMLY